MIFVTNTGFNSGLTLLAMVNTLTCQTDIGIPVVYIVFLYANIMLFMFYVWQTMFQDLFLYMHIEEAAPSALSATKDHVIYQDH